ncbi:MAG: hypothetical protein H6765_03510 [Candidatus Peribacteria bacterium]|nr:MAG: hypothetical protein H6765_03510 [Candidatus Peribacteria bacterium]
MFATKSLVILPGVPKDSTPTNKAKAAEATAVEEFLMHKYASISPDVTVVLVCYKPDKRTKMYKFLLKEAEVKEFNTLSTTELSQFVNKQLGTLTTPQLSEHIINLVGTNLYNLAHESDKLRRYCSYNHITQLTNQIIEDIVYQQSETNSFNILDNLYTNNKKALSLINKLQQEQVDTFQFLGMLYRGLKLVLSIVDLYDQGITSSKAIASQLKAHPFAVSKQLGNIRSLQKNKEGIINFYDRLITLDSSIKTGRLPQESFWLEIKSAVLELGSPTA